MKLLRSIQAGVVALCLVLTLLTTSACGSATQTRSSSPTASNTTYSQLERGNTATGQQFGSWVVQTAKGMIQDAFVRDNDKLGVVISSNVRPTEVRPLARSLMQGFQHNFPNQDLMVLVYGPDKELILTAQYDRTSQQITYQS